MRGTEPAEASDEQRGYFARGKQLQAHIAERFARRYGRDQIVVEKAIPWPAGIAHGDVFVKPEKLAVEIKSTASRTPQESHILQLAGQVEFDPDAEHGALVMVNPSNLLSSTLPMPAVTDDLRERVHEIADAVAAAADPDSPLPARVCERPSDAISRMCPFADVCFADWQPPDPIELEPQIAHLAADLDAHEKAVKDARRALAEREEERELVRAQLRHVMEPASEYAASDDELLVRITPVAGRVTWDVKTAIELGAVDASALEPFKRVGRPSERWKVRTRHADEEQEPGAVLAGLGADVDYGDVPF